ncbi:MAG: hypothetical protein ACK4UO_09140 [Pseudolabrys sp.]
MAQEMRQENGADRLGKAIANVFLALLALLFIYGYVVPLVVR